MGIRRLSLAFQFVVVAGLATAVLSACGGESEVGEAGNFGVEVSDLGDGANADDVMFAQMMIPHHEQAVLMAGLAADRAEDEQLRALATEIKAAQDPEIALMSSWLDRWGAPRMSGDEAVMSHGSHGMQGMLSDAQLDALQQAQGATFDALFAQYMIEHHEGAVTMAEDVLARGADPAVAALAREIVVTQEKEIVQLRSFLSGESTAELTSISPALGHVHGAVVDGDELLVGTHDGLHRVDPVTGASVRVGDSQDDLMAFAGSAQTMLVASGHPGPGSSMPNPLGLMTSSDAGRTWKSSSLQGQVDFHSLAIRGDEIVGWDTRGPLQWSTDGGANWQVGPLVTPISIAWFNDRIWMGTPDRGLLTWMPGENEVREVGQPGVLIAASPDGETLWRLDGDGSVLRSSDGQIWTRAGRVSQVEALAGDSTTAYVVTGSSVARVLTSSS